MILRLNLLFLINVHNNKNSFEKTKLKLEEIE